MIRPWRTWTIFGLCLLVLAAAMGYLSVTAMDLDSAQQQAQQLAALEENVRLALWRMDSALAPFIAQENARPYFVYVPFYPAERAYTRMFAEIDIGDVLVPSALLEHKHPDVLIHFQFDPQGDLSSPQVPVGNMQDLAEVGYITHERIVASAARLSQLQQLVTKERLLDALDRHAQSAPDGSRMPLIVSEETLSSQQAVQLTRNVDELAVRNVTQMNVLSQQKASSTSAPLRPKIKETMITPLWIDSKLVLVRRVSVNGEDYVQGCWLDWTRISTGLLSTIHDLLPDADLVPLGNEVTDTQARILAALPVRLLPGKISSAQLLTSRPIYLSLIIAWICAAVAATAVASLLLGALSLSEKRGAFVSSVTHELRSPLTTFRLYTEMLSEGMVKDEEKQRKYLSTLKCESERLSHLIENVLAYSRLERTGIACRMETLPVQEIIDRVSDRLCQRAQIARMSLEIETDDTVSQMHLTTDVSAVEQILFNLVDNACKYTSDPSDRRIHLITLPTRESVALCVRDHGPGLSLRERRSLFRPFRKSAQDAAHSAPGVGLGLALCRRLAKSIGGTLNLDDCFKDGAAFVLRLPI